MGRPDTRNAEGRTHYAPRSHATPPLQNCRTGAELAVAAPLFERTFRSIHKNSSRTGEGEPTLEAVQPLSIDWIRHNGHLTNRVRGGESFFPEGSWSTSVEGFDFSFHHRDGTQSIHFDRTSPKLSQPFKIAPRHGETRDARAPGSTLLTDDPGGLRDPPGP